MWGQPGGYHHFQEVGGCPFDSNGVSRDAADLLEKNALKRLQKPGFFGEHGFGSSTLVEGRTNRLSSSS